MGLKLGNLNVSNVRLGALQINSVYLGGTLVWPEGINFQPGFSSAIVRSIALQSDGKILSGGNFITYQGVSANYIIRLNADGSRDTTFAIGTGFNITVRSIIIQPDNKILIGGDFTTYQGVAANRIIRLNADGSRDTTFAIGTGFPSNGVFSIAVQSDGKVLVGGSFQTYQGVSANRIIRLNADGSRDTTFAIGTGFSDEVSSIAIQTDGKILAGGMFETYQGVSATRIIRLNADGSRDTTFAIGTGFNNTVWSIAIQPDGKILAGGRFAIYQGVAANCIIALNSDGSRFST
jgi:uncharacterized delta-60 repeat protein